MRSTRAEAASSRRITVAGLKGLGATLRPRDRSTAGKLPYLPSKTEFQPGTWYHVAGTYDGMELKIYVNGQLENSAPLTGRIDYPPKANLQIGAYRDQDENYCKIARGTEIFSSFTSDKFSGNDTRSDQ